MLTLSRLLELPELELKLLVSGDGDSLERELLWLHNTELPDPSGYVRPGELVLTNGMWIDETTPEAFVDSVRRAEAAGVVFGLRKELPETPPALVEACERARFPLAEISVSVPFTSVTRAAAAILAEARLRELTGTIRRSGALSSAITRGTGATGILQVVRREHDLPLAVVDRTGRQLAVAGAELSEGQLRQAARLLNRHPPPLEIDLDGTTASMFLVTAVGDVDAALLCLRPYRDLTLAERDSLEQASSFLSLEVAKQQAVHAIEQRFAGEVLDMVQAGPTRERDAAERLRAFGVDPTGPIGVLAVTGTALASETTRLAAETVVAFFLEHGVAALVASGTHDIVALIAWPKSERSLRSLAEELHRTTAQATGHDRLVVGIGGVSAGSSGLRAVLVRARETCRAIQRQHGGALVQAFSELDSHRLLLGMLDQETLGRFADGILSELREQDRLRGADLELTLRTFLENDGQYAATAQRLHIHVNTLRNRIARLAEVTGRDARRTSDRVDLFLALEADAIR